MANRKAEEVEVEIIGGERKISWSLGLVLKRRKVEIL